MAASSRSFATQFDFKLRRLGFHHPLHRDSNNVSEFRKRRRVNFEGERVGVSRISCCCSDSVLPIRRATEIVKSVEKSDEWRFGSKKVRRRVRIQASPALPFASPQYDFIGFFYFLWK